MSNQILLVSSNTIDNIFDDKGRLIRQQPGGPARYCLSVLQIENIPYFLYNEGHTNIRKKEKVYRKGCLEGRQGKGMGEQDAP